MLEKIILTKLKSEIGNQEKTTSIVVNTAGMQQLTPNSPGQNYFLLKNSTQEQSLFKIHNL